MTPQKDDIFDFQLMRHPLTELFHLSTLLQMLNRRMVGTASFGRFSCSYDRMSLDGPLHRSLPLHACQLPMAGHRLLVFKALVSFVKLLEAPLHCTFISTSWVKCVDVASCLCCFMTHFELE